MQIYIFLLRKQSSRLYDLILYLKKKNNYMHLHNDNNY